MSAIVSQITGVSMVCATVCSGADQWKHQSFVSLAFVRGIRRSPVNFPAQRASNAEIVSIDDVIMSRAAPRFVNDVNIAVATIAFQGKVAVSQSNIFRRKGKFVMLQTCDLECPLSYYFETTFLNWNRLIYYLAMDEMSSNSRPKYRTRGYHIYSTSLKHLMHL